MRALEHDPEKWVPVFRLDHAPLKITAHAEVYSIFDGGSATSHRLSLNTA
jgi:hypothetical protein